MAFNRAPSADGRRIAGRSQNDPIQDPYAAAAKIPEPSACPDCGALYHHGRWQWGRVPDGAHQHRCAACRRIAEDLPAGILTVHGPLPAGLGAEIIGLFRHQEAAEKAEHPLNRIIDIAEADGGLVVRTTDIHLPRRLATALERAHHGELEIHFDEDGYFVRIDWRPRA